MLVPYLRSSLIGSYSICEHKSFIEYNLGIKGQSNFSADSGTSTHKSLELLAQKKKAIQDGKGFIDNEIFDEPYDINLITEESAFEMGWSHCKKVMNHHTQWDCVDTKVIYKSMYDEMLKFRGGEYNPLNLDVIEPEQYFDIEIKEDWAKYDYLIDGEKYSGFLSVKGTMDLIFNNTGYLSGMDYKTGKSRRDWATGKTKDLEAFKKDKQLLLYSFAIKNLFNIDEFSIIIYYLQAGGPYEVYFDKKTYKQAENMIKEYFLKISRNTSPSLAKNGDWYSRSKCKWCDYNKVRPEFHKTKTVCEFFSDNLVNLGMDKVMAKYVKKDKIFAYGSGGGRGIQEKAIDG